MAPNDSEDYEAQLRRWNKPATDHGFDLVVGQQVPEGDTRATAAAGQEALNDPITGGSGYSDDADGDEEGYQGMNVKSLKAEIDRRNEGRDDEDKISKSGNKDDLIAALEADDEPSDDDEEDEDEE